MSEQNRESGAVPLERIVGRLAAGWKLRALTLEQSGVMLASQCLRECADELEAALQGRDPQRTSWFRHEDEMERLRATAQSVCDVVDAWEIEDRGLVSVSDVMVLVQPLRPNADVTGLAPAKEVNHE